MRSQGNNDPGTNDRSPSTLIPIEAEGFHAYADAFAMDGQWVIFLSIAGHKDAVKAIRATLLTNHWVNVGVHEVCLLPRTKYGTIVRTLPCGIAHTALFIINDLEPGSRVGSGLAMQYSAYIAKISVSTCDSCVLKTYLFSGIDRFNPRQQEPTGISPFQPFQTCDRFAPFKTFQWFQASRQFKV